MIIVLTPELEAALVEKAKSANLPPEDLALRALQERFLKDAALRPRNPWECALLDAASDCGISLPESALTSESLYE